MELCEIAIQELILGVRKKEKHAWGMLYTLQWLSYGLKASS